MPGISAFPEVNVRTYARYRGRPGVWFLSLDAAGRVAVEVARRATGLPYYRARMSLTADADGWLDFRSEREDARGAPVDRVLERAERLMGRWWLFHAGIGTHAVLLKLNCTRPCARAWSTRAPACATCCRATATAGFSLSAASIAAESVTAAGSAGPCAATALPKIAVIRQHKPRAHGKDFKFMR